MARLVASKGPMAKPEEACEAGKEAFQASRRNVPN